MFMWRSNLINDRLLLHNKNYLNIDNFSCASQWRSDGEAISSHYWKLCGFEIASSQLTSFYKFYFYSAPRNDDAVWCCKLGTEFCLERRSPFYRHCETRDEFFLSDKCSCGEAISWFTMMFSRWVCFVASHLLSKNLFISAPRNVAAVWCCK